jgi:hypothetical protein
MNRLFLLFTLFCSSLAFGQHAPSLKKQVAANNPPTATDHTGQTITVTGVTASSTVTATGAVTGSTVTATAGVLRSAPQATTGDCTVSGDYGKLIVLSTDGWGRLCTASGWLLVPMVLTNGAGTALDYAEIAADAEATLTLTVTGAASGDRVECSATAKLETGIVISNKWVSAADTVSVTLLNTTAAPVNPVSATFICGAYKQ